jgi:flagellar FliL protein
MGELGSNEARTKIKAELLERISKAYDGEIMDVYFTEFVMQ